MNTGLVVKVVFGLSLYLFFDYLQDGTIDGSLFQSYPQFHSLLPGMAKWGQGSLTRGKTNNPHRKRGSMKSLTRSVNTEEPWENKKRTVEVQITLRGQEAERFLWYWRKQKK
jgi:hypothetical protein